MLYIQSRLHVIEFRLSPVEGHLFTMNKHNQKPIDMFNKQDEMVY